MVRRILVVLLLTVCAGCGASPSTATAPDEVRARLRAYLGADGFDYELVLELSDVQVTQKSVGVFEKPDRLEYTLDTGDRIRVLGNRIYEHDDATGWTFSRTFDTKRANFPGLLSPFLDAEWVSVGNDARAETDDASLVASVEGSRLNLELDVGKTTHYSIRLSNLNSGQRVENLTIGRFPTHRN